MAMTNAEKQAAYRERHLTDVEGSGARLNTVIDHSAKLALARLASAYGVSQRAMLELLVRDAEHDLLQGLSDKQRAQYYDQALTVTA